MRNIVKAAIAVVLVALVMLFLTGASAGGAETEATTTTTGQETTPAPVDPWTDPAYRAKVVKAYRAARLYQRSTHRWSHKMGVHGSYTHVRFAMTHSLKYESWRANRWRARSIAARKAYQTCLRPRPTVPRSVRVKGARTSLHQRRNITAALNIARKRDVPMNHRLALIAAATQEQSTNNQPYGHGTSVGFLQLIDIHGSVAWRMQLRNSVNWFLNGARKVDPHGRMAPGSLAQAVQRSAHPDLYHQWVPEVRRTYRLYIGRCVRV